MRVPNEKDLLKNNEEEIILEISDILDEVNIYPPNPDFNNEKEKYKFIFSIEQLVRTSTEYKKFVYFLRNNLDITKCTFHPEVDTKDLRKTKLEFHHYPIDLYTIVETIVDSYDEGEYVNPYEVADKVMLEHYRFNIGLVPLSKTVHELYHSGKKFINLKYVYGKYERFMNGQYGSNFSDEARQIVSDLKALSKKDDEEGIKENILDTVKTKVIITGIEKPKKIKSCEEQIIS